MTSHEAVVLALYTDSELRTLQRLVEDTRERLATWEVLYTLEKARLDAWQARLFHWLHPHQQKRDGLRVVLQYRRLFLEKLLQDEAGEAGRVEQEYQQARKQAQEDFRNAAAGMESRTFLSAADEAELAALWKRLVKLYHPDRFAGEPEKLEAFGKLTALINRAKSGGDLATLRQIADDPHGFLLQQGWARLDFGEEFRLSQLRKLWESLQLEILRVIEATHDLRESADYELSELVRDQPELLGKVVRKKIAGLESEIAQMQQEEDRLTEQIEELTSEVEW